MTNGLRDAHGGTTTDKNTVATFWQTIEGGFIGYPDMSADGQFQATTNHGTVQGGNNRDTTVADVAEYINLIL